MNRIRAAVQHPAVGAKKLTMAVVAIFTTLAGSAFSQVAAPVFAPSGVVKDSVPFTVTVSCVTPGATIHYTTNGAVPSLTDPLVPANNLVGIPRSLILKAVAWSGATASAVTSADYQVVGQIAAGGFHSLAVKSSMAAYSWGLQTNGALGNGTGSVANQLNPGLVKSSSTVNFPDAAEVAGGRKHGVALLDSGAVQAFGLNTSGQLGNNSATTPTDYFPVAVLKSTLATDYLTGCKQVCAADSYSAALAANGNVYTWGGDVSGRLGRSVSGTNNLYARRVGLASDNTVPLSGIQQIACGKYHMLARTPHVSESAGGTGRVWVWGLNSSGQLGLGNTTDYDRAFQTTSAFLADVNDLSAGDAHTAVVRWKSTIQGKVYCFGQSQYGRLGNNSTTAGIVLSPVLVQKVGGGDLDHIIAVSAGPRHTLALDDTGHVWSWGCNANGELGDGTLTSAHRGYAAKVQNSINTGDLLNIVNISAGGVENAGFSLATAEDGTIYAWGANTFDQLGTVPPESLRNLPQALTTLKLTDQGTPSVSLTPTMAKSYEAVTVAVDASITDLDGMDDIVSVAFSNGTTSLGTDTQAPFSVSLPNLTAGTYNFSAVVTDRTGHQGSGTLTVNILACVSVQAINSLIAEGSPTNGIFRISRLTAKASPLTVAFALTGPALNGRDYQQVAQSATIPANQTSVDVVIAAKADYLAEPTEDVILTLQTNGDHVPNPLATSVSISITNVVPVYDPDAGNLDTDGDGLLDSEEIALGLQADEADSDHDGIPDGIDPQPLIPDTVPLAAAATILIWNPAE